MNSEDEEFLEGLRKDFIEESYDLLQKCEESLLNFEKNLDVSFFQEYMRILHSMKGSARAVEFDTYATTLHLIEGLGLKSKDHLFIEMSLSSLDGLKISLDLAKDGHKEEMENKLQSILNSIGK